MNLARSVLPNRDSGATFRLTALRLLAMFVDLSLCYFGRFAPYLDRLCFLSFTAAQSSDPRTTW